MLLSMVEAKVSVSERAATAMQLQGFEQWMVNQRGATRSTVVAYTPTLRRLLDAERGAAGPFSAASLRRFVTKHALLHGPSHARRVVTAMRSFLRYLVAQGECSADLIAAIPAIAAWRQASLPRYLHAPAVRRIIESCDRRTATGRRDYAILMLLSRLGLRGGEVATLDLCDIDWEQGTLRLCGKGRAEARLPLPQDVGDALLAYLERGRPAAEHSKVFLRSDAVPRPFVSSGMVSAIVARAIRRAGIVAPSYGAHLLRHSSAFEMLRQGSSLPAIAAVLRHRSISTTALYAKVDVGALDEIAQPWPKVTR